MRLLATSDLHGSISRYRGVEALIYEHRPDWIVLLGDLLPDIHRGRGTRLEAQQAFWSRHRHRFIRGHAVTTLVRGNHEIEGFIDSELQSIPEVLEDRVVRLEGIPAEHGAWGWSREWDEGTLGKELRKQIAVAPEPWLYLSHVPPLGLRDRSKEGEHIGHRALARHLHQRQWPLATVLCGHVHEGFGREDAGATTVLNVAGGFALLEWPVSGLDGCGVGWNILAMDQLCRCGRN